jgi:2-keto-4-pentenoate hydratase
MSAKSLAERGATEPLIGSLFSSGDLSSGAEVNLCGYRRAVFELKIGYIFRSPVTEKQATVDDLAALVDSVQPIVELPDIAYRDDKTYNAVDMAAANISSARFVRATARPLGTIDLDNLRVSLSRDATRVASGTGRDSLGSQWESLRTVVNLVIANGGRIAPGEIVITGKIGAKGDLLPGYYSADYDALGALNFTVSKCASPPWVSPSEQQTQLGMKIASKAPTGGRAIEVRPPPAVVVVNVRPATKARTSPRMRPATCNTRS